MSLTIFCDIDGTLINTLDTVVNLYNADFNDSVLPGDIATYNFSECAKATTEQIYSYFDDDRFFKTIDFIDSNAPKYLKELSKIYNITFATIGSEYNIKKKKEWLAKRLNFNFEVVGIPEGISKGTVDMSNGIIIDDVSNNLLSSNAQDKICFGQVYNWNTDWNGLRFNWEQIYKYLMIRQYQHKSGYNILLNTLERVNSFCKLANKYSVNIFAQQGRFLVDGCSILGVLSLNVLLPITLSPADNNPEFYNLLYEMSDYLIVNDD